MKEAKTNLETKEKAYKDLGGVTGNALAKQQRDARKEARERKKLQEELAEELLELHRKNQEADIALMDEGREKKLAKINQEYEETIEEIDRREKELLEKQGGTTTIEQRVELSKARENADAIRSKSVSDLDKEEAEKRRKQMEEEQRAMDEYLKQYGTYGQKVAATVRLYRQMIGQAVTKGEKLVLQKQLESALSEIDFNRLKDEINWSAVFGNISTYTKKELEKMKSQLEAFRKSEEYSKFTPENKESIENAIAQIQQSIDDKGGLFAPVISAMQGYRQAMDELRQAQEEYNKALQDGDEAVIEAAKKKLNAAQGNAADKKANVRQAGDDTTRKVIGLTNAITQLGSSAEMTLSELGGVAESVGNLFGEMGNKIGGIIGTAQSLLDAIGEQGLGKFSQNLTNSIFKAVGSVLDFGTFGLIDFGGLSNENVDTQLEDLTRSNEDLKIAMDNLSEKMEDASVMEVNDIYSRQLSNLQEQMLNTQQQMQLAGDVHDDGFLGIGGSHSSNYKIDSGMTADDWRKVSQAAGRTVQSAADFWALTSEEMAAVANDATTQYSKLKGLADDGARDAAQYMDQYIEYYRQLEELELKRQEVLTSTSFDSVKDSFKNALLDMRDDAEDFAEDLESMLQNAVAEAITGTFDNEIRQWYETFANYMDSGGELDAWEVDDLRRRWEDIVNKGREQWQAASDVLGFSEGESDTPSQQASSAVTVQASQESVDMANGRLLAIQDTASQISETIKSMSIISSLIVSSNSFLNDMLQQHVITNSYLFDISAFQKSMLNTINVDMISILNDIKKSLS